ncbi:MAG: 16S rRNA (cytidine(1402)-2'-O)-methyltransferase [Bacteroidota bacterium]|nr:16S rRNA (cytidine(1402)-2'-O)-methyltransferase [Bacteroidota bacterium]MEC8637982.1 16S rRNA (cytidine(1402)-2'-O)-methyltransferase [Bacteroidota bacterium]
MEIQSSTLYVVPTPIGNLADITHRSIDVLSQVELILCEDTRVSQKLLKHYNIDTPTKSYHTHNEHRTVDRLVEQLQQGMSMALISDAGTPAISDPGFLLVRACLQSGVNVTSLPGPTAFVPALVQSGFPTDRFVFEGFLPHKKGRNSRLSQLAEETKTIVLYESPHRILKTLVQCAQVMGPNRQASISRELTKAFEETVQGTLEELEAHFTSHTPKGEFVLVIQGKN